MPSLKDKLAAEEVASKLKAKPKVVKNKKVGKLGKVSKKKK
ncbi:MAG: hypothetical protein UT82_C0028G0004 [Parcubacteria group bacterium GW2011_GWB1_40_14]|nr:MAG: hypothetical protein UT82_C0028G0004 [Parcubacteria group bacterium GW2011_GWB1_40_14]